MPRRSAESRAARTRKKKYRRARIRHFLFTAGPDRLSRGRIVRRHLSGDVEVRELEITSAAWPEAFDGFRIAHVSDFHLGRLMPLDRALEVVDLIAAQEPDLVACTGDVVDLHHDEAGPLLDALAAVEAPCGSALVLGNHDELHCAETVSRLAEAAGLILLRDDAVSITHDGETLLVAGIDWAKTAAGCGRRVDLACGEFVHLLLAHNPRAFDRAAELGVPLTLSGHTHGGQLALRNRPTANLALTHRYRAGLYEAGPSRLFVTSGVGSWFPLRVNCPPEIAVITMRNGV